VTGRNDDEGAHVHDVKWCNPMVTAPRNGTLLRLRVDYSGDEAKHALWNNTVAWTVGFNNFENDGEDFWRIAGWNWSHDCFTEGRGAPIGWLPFHGETA
jgi:hypothetical protein